MKFASLPIFINKLLISIRQHVDDTGAQYIAFGIFGILNYPLSYFMWHDVIQQAYNPFSFRLIAGILCVPLVLKNYWPKSISSFLPIYWYLTLLYCLPFFGTYMLLKNQISNAWLMNDVLGLFLLMLLVDWISFIVLIAIGISLGWLCYILTGGILLAPINKNSVYLAMYMYTFAIVIGGVFSRNKENVAKEKLIAIKSISASIAHELRTPFRTISAVNAGIKKYLPRLLETYILAKEAHLPIPVISDQHHDKLNNACNVIESEIQASFTIINMLLMNVNQKINSIETKICSINNCIKEALQRYPFDLDEEKLISWDSKNNFTFRGNELYMVHVIFNLLKNALYQIKHAGKGEIFIWVTSNKKYHILHFKDTASGISPKILANIFNHFYSNVYHGTGIGLAFCKKVIENIGGKIECKSIEGKYAEFLLYIPHIKSEDDI